MVEPEILEPAIDPNNRISFLLDWELTMKCNLDCGYCPVGIYGGHDNSQPHPALAACFDTIDFMLEYADIYMQAKPRGIRYVILNVYGGESLHHPQIPEILQRVRDVYEQNYRQRWNLTITTTTNAIINKPKLTKIIPLIDEFTVSYHCNNTVKQKQLFKSNILDISAANKRIKCIVLMHPEPDLFADAQQMIAWCEQHNVKFLPRQIDQVGDSTQFNYETSQVIWFDKMYTDKTHKISNRMELPDLDPEQKINLSRVGRACCGGRSLCKDQDYKGRDVYVHNRFPDWFCSVNEFFVFIKQVNGEIFVNKDCKMNFNGEIGPIGNLNDTKTLLQQLRSQIKLKDRPVIRCKKYRCFCGLCAPKAKLRSDFDSIMEKYRS